MKNKKGGRPKKGAAKLSRRVLVKLNPVDFFALKTKAKQAGVCIAAFARQAIAEGQVVARFTPERMDYYRKIAGMGNNLNQLTKKAHREGFARVVAEIERLLAELDAALKQLSYDR